jgi:hypothetical protein
MASNKSNPREPADSRRRQPRQLTADEALVLEFRNNPDSHGLSLRSLSKLIGFGKSMVQETPTWQELQRARRQLVGDYAAGSRCGNAAAVAESSRYVDKNPVDPITVHPSELDWDA